MILVTGAAGKTGQAVIRALLNRGARVRGLVRRPEQVARLQNMGVSDTVVGDIQQESTLHQAWQGVEAVYLICPNMHPDETAIGRMAIQAAQMVSGVHLVYHSVLHPHTQKMPHHWRKLRVEELLFESAQAWTILQPAAYLQNILASWPAILAEGVYRVPYPVETRLGMVDLEDVAEVAATVLSEPGHAGAIYELAGPEVLSQREVTVVIGEVLGRPVQAEEIPLDKWANTARAGGLGDYQVETLLKMFQYYAQYGFWGNPHVLHWLLGRQPSGLRAFLERVNEKL
jgi:uncharacterized protein YbjT (DUF2867 family)